MSESDIPWAEAATMQVPETRLSLVVRLRDPGDSEAWSQFLAEYEPFLLNLFRRRGLQEADARDVAQQVLMSVAGRVTDWRPDGRPASFRRWLTTIARNAAVKCLAKKSRRPQVDLGSAVDRVAAVGDQAAAELEYRQEVLAWAMAQIRDEFQPTSWGAFWETAVQSRSIGEVCAELGLSAGAVYMARSRVMARLREKSKEFDPDEDATA